MEKKYMKAKKLIKDHEQKNEELSDQVRTLKSKVLSINMNYSDVV